VGVAASSLWAMRRREIPRAAALGGGLIGAAAGLVLFALTESLSLHCAAAFLAGLATGPLIASSETELQNASGERRRARAFAVRDFLSRMVFLISAAAAMIATQALSASAALCMGAALIGGLGIVITVTSLRTRTG
jgi:hypothetical protein